LKKKDLLKNNWPNKKLGDICYIKLGKTPHRANKIYWDEKKVTTNIWLSIADLLNSRNKIVYDSKEYISNKGASISKIVKTGTLLVSFKLTLGRLAFAGCDLYTNEAIASLELKNDKEINKYYLYYFLFFYDWQDAAKGDVKIKGKTLNKAKLKLIDIPLPPLPEQKRIVKILDKAFAAIDKAIANTQKNLQNSKELFDSYINNIFSNPGEDWEREKLGNVAKINYGYTEKASIEAIGPRFLRITDIQNHFVNWNSVPFCRINKEQLPKFLLADGDIVFARTGATTGKSYLIKNPPSSVYASYLIRLQIQNKNLDPKFVYMFFQTQIYWDKIKLGISGSAQGGFNATKLNNLEIIFPNTLKQKQIVKKLDDLLSKTQELESIYQQKLKDLEELKKSILQKAFEGEL